MFTQFKLAIYAAIVVAILSGVTGIYLKGRYDAKHAAELDTLKRTIALVSVQKERAEEAAKQDAKKLVELEAELASYEILVTEIEHELEDPDRVCLDPADVERLRRLFENKSR